MPTASPPTALVHDLQLADLTTRQVSSQLRQCLAQGAKLQPAGVGREDPDELLRRYPVGSAVQLFGAHFWLGDMRHDDFLNFLVAYVGLEDARGRIRSIHPRLFYKDSSLMWRVASHFVSNEDEHWIGKGDVRWETRPDGEYLSSAEETTNLPFELQGALDHASRKKKSRRDPEAVHWILREGSKDRTQPFADFVRPRAKAAERFQIYGGKPVVSFRKKGQPATMTYAKGFEPDFAKGILEVLEGGSRLYGGALKKYRILSKNRQIQYQFVASPTHVFVNHPQTLTTELTTYGTRTLDVMADDDAFVPGFEYHFMDEATDPPTLHSQIPEGYVGVVGDPDPERADASPWLEALPIVQQFRRQVLRQ
ncbi:MAG: hypothetical protein H6830_07695 [Planctomycetes bacterium]|nr:hypothetical protein [Planctomycetota bacterium]MCB9910282.1 hypothetical protein [Planctomycetota bacterium]HPF13436.1 hypothetical protein [Planctomycetota bacterium]